MEVDVGEVLNENQIIQLPDLLVPYSENLRNALDYLTEREPPLDEETERVSTPVSLESVQTKDGKPDPESENTKNASICGNDEDEGRLCPICLDNWTNTGDHRVCALKCGHLFGFKCVNRWLASQTRKSCPTCKERVVKSDIRYIYAKRLIAVDTSEIEIIKNQLEKVTEEKNTVQIELTRALCREHALKKQVNELKQEIRGLSQTLEYRILGQSNATNAKQRSENVRFYMDKSIDLCSEGGCRVLTFNPTLELVIASVKSSNALFSGYGIRLVSMSEYRPVAYIHLHHAPIRDVAFQPHNNWIATVSLDKSFKILDGNSTSTAFSVNCENQLWSCCWDSTNSNILYVGAQQGSVYKYDVRNINEAVCTYSVPGDMSPVVSVSAVEGGPGEAMPSGGVISCKLNSVWVFENVGNEHVKHCLPLEGPFVCMRYHNPTKQLLVSSRPNLQTPYARHTLCTLSNKASDILGCNVIHTFNGGGTQKLLSRTAFFSQGGDYVAAHHEQNNSVYLWSINTGSKVGAIPTHNPILDICACSCKGVVSLACLTEKKLEFFKLAK